MNVKIYGGMDGKIDEGMFKSMDIWTDGCLEKGHINGLING